MSNKCDANSNGCFFFFLFLLLLFGVCALGVATDLYAKESEARDRRILAELQAIEACFPQQEQR